MSHSSFSIIFEVFAKMNTKQDGLSINNDTDIASYWHNILKIKAISEILYGIFLARKYTRKGIETMNKVGILILNACVLLMLTSFNLSASNQSGDPGIKDVTDKISRALQSSDMDLIDSFIAEGNRVFSDWEEVFSSKGFFGKAQIILSLQKFFKENEMLGAQVPEHEIKQLSGNKMLFKVLMTYKNRLKETIINRNIFFLLVIQHGAENPHNPSGWVISEIKKIN